MSDIFSNHVLPDVVRDPQLGIHAFRTFTGFPELAAKSICVCGIEFAQLLWPAVRFTPGNGKCSVHLPFHRVVVELEIVNHREDVSPKVSEAFSQQEEPIRHASQFEVVLRLRTGDATIVEGQVVGGIGHLRKATGSTKLALIGCLQKSGKQTRQEAVNCTKGKLRKAGSSLVACTFIARFCNILWQQVP